MQSPCVDTLLLSGQFKSTFWHNCGFIRGRLHGASCDVANGCMITIGMAKVHVLMSPAFGLWRRHKWGYNIIFHRWLQHVECWKWILSAEVYSDCHSFTDVLFIRPARKYYYDPWEECSQSYRHIFVFHYIYNDKTQSTSMLHKSRLAGVIIDAEQSFIPYS